MIDNNSNSKKCPRCRIHSNDLSNVATAAAAATTHLNHLTVNNTHNNITNTNIQVDNKTREQGIINHHHHYSGQAATAAASAAVSLATQSGIAVASASGLVQASLVGAHNAGYNNNNKIRFRVNRRILRLKSILFTSDSTSGTGVWSSCSTTTELRNGNDRLTSSTTGLWWLTDLSGGFQWWSYSHANPILITLLHNRDNELFEIRLDRLVDKWSGSIEVFIFLCDPNILSFWIAVIVVVVAVFCIVLFFVCLFVVVCCCCCCCCWCYCFCCCCCYCCTQISQVGLTTHNPGQLDFPATMTNLRLGTTMMRWRPRSFKSSRLFWS